MSCSHWQSAIDGLIDDQLDHVTARRLDDHLATCGDCRGWADDLRALRQATAALPIEIAPPRDLWPTIASRLAPRRQAAAGQRWRRWGLGTSLAMSLATAAAALIVLGLWLVSQGQARPLVRSASSDDRLAAVRSVADASPLAGPAIAATRDAAISLRVQVESRWQGLTPGTRLVLERNLNVIDQAILEIETALAREPDDRALQSFLLASYRQQISLLERLVKLG